MTENESIAVPSVADEPGAALERPDPKFLTVMRIGAALPFTVAMIALGVVEMSGRLPPLLPPGLGTTAIALILGVLIFTSTRRRYLGWGYSLDADELIVAYGVWGRVRTNVPLARVQHIDVVQGVVERRLGLANLVVHTAGTRNYEVGVPGLPVTTAEAMRDAIRARILREAE